MATLTEKEVEDLLSKLGINSSDELKSYLEEYKVYLTQNNSDTANAQHSFDGK